MKYEILPIELLKDIRRLVFPRFTAGGKVIDKYLYYNEWIAIQNFNSIISPPNISTSKDQPKTINEQNLTSQRKVVKADSLVKIRYKKDYYVFNIQLVDYQTKIGDSSNGIQKVYNKAPIAIAIIGKPVGETVTVGREDNIVQIIELLN